MCIILTPNAKENETTRYILLVKRHTCRRGGFRPPPQAGEKCIGGVEKREKKERKGENQAKIGQIRLKIEKEGENRRKSSNLAKNRYKWLKIVSSYAKNRNHLDLTEKMMLKIETRG